MRYIFIVGAMALSLLGCVSEDHFGKSNRSEIKTFVIPGQTGSSVINNDSLTVVVTIPDTMTDFMLEPSEISLSNFATVMPEVGQVQDFSSPVDYSVTAEDGSISIYEVSVLRGGSQPQLANASFEDWYTESVAFSTVEQPGIDATSTIWGTANRGLALGGAPGNTSKQERNNTNYVKMESVAAPALVRIAAATIFTGKFTDDFPSINDPKSNITLGTPFSARPLSFSFSYTYQPGPNNEDGDGKPLAYGDQCDIYLFLENRDGAEVKRVGTAWFRNGLSVSEWSKENVTIKYGPLDASDPWYDYAQPPQGEVWGDGTETITHITILATSSFEGDFFNGAIGSTMELDDIELLYQ